MTSCQKMKHEVDIGLCEKNEKKIFWGNVLNILNYIKTYQGFGTPNSPGNTASIYHVNIP